MKNSNFELNDERNGYNDGKDCSVSHTVSQLSLAHSVWY